MTAALPVGAHLSVPIRLADGQVFGTFCCFRAAPDHSLNDRDLAMMRVFADLTAAPIDRDLGSERRQEDTRIRLRAAMAGDGLSMVFQPIAEMNTGEPIGFEALARFEQTPVRGPDVWFAEAAEVGLLVDLELAAIRMALHHLPELPPQAYLAVNVSPLTATSGRLDAALSDVPANRIVHRAAWRPLC
ncbi:MAG: EAL domain-containing protein [Actinomycetota bacterium]|nr:EAL domain-containing protein [Actinomycetota bacterium]PLS75960.1 MAG: hypothetical protein CYG61_04645 [Actinomycetota bacterium]